MLRKPSMNRLLRNMRTFTLGLRRFLRELVGGGGQPGRDRRDAAVRAARVLLHERLHALELRVVLLRARRPDLILEAGLAAADEPVDVLLVVVHVPVPRRLSTSERSRRKTRGGSAAMLFGVSPTRLYVWTV